MNVKKILTIFLKVSLTALIAAGMIFQVRSAFTKLTPVLENGTFSLRDFIRPDEAKIKNATRVKTLNNMRPEFAVLIQVNAGLPVASTGSLEPYRAYYEKITEYFPDIAEAHGLVGFCNYYRDGEEAAVSAFQTAAQLNPSFFYYPYNLGVIYARKGDFQKATLAFRQALGLKPEFTLKIILASSLYKQISRGLPRFTSTITEQLQKTYAEALTGLQLSLVALKDPAKAEMVRKSFPLRIKIF